MNQTNNKEIRVIIVDDERLARQELKRLFNKHSEINVIAEAENIDEGYELIQQHQPDLIFLDVEMPGGNGIALAEKLAGVFPIIFCTAYDNFAVDAFALNAIDYLVKPAVPARLAQAIAKLSHNDCSPQEQVEESVLGDDFKLMVKFADHMKIIPLGDIICFESVGNHAAIYTSQGKAYIHSSLNKIESRLSSDNYFRASRLHIVRLDAISQLEQNINYGLTAELNDGQSIEISRRQASKLKAQLGFPA